ncbi:hypothetical protein [Ktedonobacter robiniae]|uniref:Uncharacterized protein n=1 Tax=Ktedonobacter robiniae TaxID=2778365 RepID=A0ABQ3V5V5_9CHLR|nr:hypothetical protein [Ktedonobacter robiniae]GHO60413.1 hypothetical protein KSB_88880 [Ktedonobacter robiniae]
MPDVFKILKDLELKSVGLDPETNKMQEGFFVSFRSAGLPIHKEDFQNPWSPLGVNLEKDIPKTEPADPANAPKTGSAQLDENRQLSAAIAKSQQSYLDTFQLTDDKLVMNNQYAVMPGSSKVSDAWWALITGANGVPTESELNDEMKAAYEKAKAVLMDKDDNPTPHYQAYMQYEQEYKDKVKAWHRAYSDAFTNPMKLQNWPIDGTLYHDDADEALDRWVSLGHKEEIEHALATLAAQGTDPAIALISRAKKHYINSLNEFQSVGEIPYTVMLPRTWYDPDNDDGWNEYTSDDAHSESHYQSSSTSYGGGGGFSIGFWSAGASFNHADQQSSLDMQANDLEISFKYCTVDIKRPWLDTSLLNLKNWFLMGDYKKGCISDGTMGQHLPAHATEPTFLPSIVTSLILIKDLSIRWSNWKEHWDAHSETTSASVSVGYGPFSINGTYSHHGQQSNFSADTDGESLRVPGIQLIGYVSTINPLSPAVDSSQFLTKPK